MKIAFFEKSIQDFLTKSEAYEVISVFVHSLISDDILEKLFTTKKIKPITF